MKIVLKHAAIVRAVNAWNALNDASASKLLKARAAPNVWNVPNALAVLLDPRALSATWIKTVLAANVLGHHILLDHASAEVPKVADSVPNISGLMIIAWVLLLAANCEAVTMVQIAVSAPREWITHIVRMVLKPVAKCAMMIVANAVIAAQAVRNAVNASNADLVQNEKHLMETTATKVLPRVGTARTRTATSPQNN